METQLKAVEEQRDTFKQDLESTHLAKDELMKKVCRGRKRRMEV